MTKRLVMALAASALSVAAGAATAGSAADRSLASATYGDPAGDAGVAPDITGVAVSDDGTTGVISISVTATGTAATAAAPLRNISVWLDTDGNRSTGLQGADYTLQYIVSSEDAEGWHWIAERISGATFSFIPPSASVGFERNGDVFTWTIGRADIGGVASFSFDVSTGADDTARRRIGCDSAPDGGMWRYVLAAPTQTSTVVERAASAALGAVSERGRPLGGGSPAL